MIKGYKIRLFPTVKQEQAIWKHIGACRFVWNWMLTKQEELHDSGGKYMYALGMMRLLSQLRNDDRYAWLKEVSCTSCRTVCRDLDEAYRLFFDHKCGHPKFKTRKRAKQIYPVRSDRLYFQSPRSVHIEKIGHIKCYIDKRLDSTIQYAFYNARISRVNNKWILTVCIEGENQARKLTDRAMGIDLGVKESAIVAYGDEKLVFSNINKSIKVREINSRINRLQRVISKKYLANKVGNRYVKTQNIIRCENKLRRLYTRLSNIRTNYIHQSTHKLVSLLPYRVVMEDLNVSGMIKNRHLSKAIQEQCLSEWIRQTKYKCEWNGIEFVQVGRFYPSSKTCSNCGCVKSDLKLSDRTFICNECGFEIDRDFNAALNLSRYAA